MTDPIRAGAVVLLSGGQDSATVLYSARDRFARVEAVSFDYNQRHAVELEQAKLIAERADVAHHVLPLEALAVLSQASLTNRDIANVGDGDDVNVFASTRGLPPSFVPGRNLLFFTLAAALAAKIGLDTIVTGVCQQDHSGYPDCRAEFVNRAEDAIRSGFGWPEFVIHAPLLMLSKAQTFQLADQLGVLDVIVEDTHTCYEGDREHRHPWGYGCGVCGACVERSNGWDQFLAVATIS